MEFDWNLAFPGYISVRAEHVNLYYLLLMLLNSIVRAIDAEENEYYLK